MFKLALVNMPFAAAHLPSIALAQLKSVLEAELPGKVETDVFYFNQDFVRFLGPSHYGMISASLQATTSGLGDWFFRHVAFPDAEDTTDEYFKRYFRETSSEWGALRDILFEKRRMVDAFLDDLIDEHDLAGYSAVGLTSMFQQNLACFALAKKLKERNANIVTMMGGANCETPMGQVICRNVMALDFVFSGPSLLSFPRLIGHLVEGDEDGVHQVTGAFSRRKLAAAGADGVHEIGEEMNIDIDVPLDYDGFLHSYEEKMPDGSPDPVLLFETSRGCWWGERSHCTFCGLNGLTMKYRGMSVDNAREVFSRLFKYFPRVKRFDAVDNIMPRSYLRELFADFEPPGDITIFYEVKADLKAGELEVLSRAGVNEIQPGIESLLTHTLKLMKKGTTCFQNLRFLKHCLQYEVRPMWNLLIGFPGEEEAGFKKYLEDLPLLVHLPPPGGAFPVRFDRFSPYFKLAEEYGLKLRPYDFYGAIYPFEDTELKDLAYFFIDENFNAEYLQGVVKWGGKLGEMTSYWRNRWQGADGLLEPRLEKRFENGDQVVYDSRSGRPVRHKVDALGWEMLEFLQSPKKLAHLVKKLSQTPERELKKRLGSLLERGLLFEEGELYMSLLVERLEDAPQLATQPPRTEVAVQ